MSKHHQTWRGVAVFDVCDTLYATNTTLGFLRFFAERYKHEGVKRGLSRWTSKASPLFWVGAVSFRVFNRDLSRKQSLAALKGECRTVLETAAVDYANEFLPALVNTPLHERLDRHVADGDRVILLSSSLDIVISPIARSLGVEYRASRLGFRDDVCTGAIEQDLTGNKVQALSAIIGRPSGLLTVYSDNRTDLSLLRLADRPTIVIPRSRPSHRWGDDRCDYLEL